MKRATINDSDRENFVINHEGFHNLWTSTMKGERKLRQFVRDNRELIDSAWRRACNPKNIEADEPYYMRGRGSGPGSSPAPDRLRPLY